MDREIAIRFQPGFFHLREKRDDQRTTSGIELLDRKGPPLIVLGKIPACSDPSRRQYQVPDDLLPVSSFQPDGFPILLVDLQKLIPCAAELFRVGEHSSDMRGLDAEVNTTRRNPVCK